MQLNTSLALSLISLTTAPFIYYWVYKRYFIKNLANFTNKYFKGKKMLVFVFCNLLLTSIPKTMIDLNEIKEKAFLSSLTVSLTLLYSISSFSLLLNKKETYFRNRVIYISFVFIFFGAIGNTFIFTEERINLLVILTFGTLALASFFLISMEMNDYFPYCNIIEGTEQKSRKESSLSEVFDFFFFDLEYENFSENFKMLFLHVFVVFCSFNVSFFFFLGKNLTKMTNFSIIILLSAIFISFFGLLFKKHFFNLYSILFTFFFLLTVSYILNLSSMNLFTYVLGGRENVIAEICIKPALLCINDAILMKIMTVDCNSLEVCTYILFTSSIYSLFLRTFIIGLKDREDFAWENFFESELARKYCCGFLLVYFLISLLSFEASRGKMESELGLSNFLVYILFSSLICLDSYYKINE